jgi:hypothetical protein
MINQLRTVAICAVALCLSAASAGGRAEVDRSGARDITAATWYGNRLGMNDELPSPWEPVTVKGRRVSCWGRSYAFQSGPLPTSVVATGEELLARPIAVTVTTKGSAATWKKSVPKISPAHSGTYAVVNGCLTDGHKAPVALNVRSRVEYDGLVLVEVTADEAARMEESDISLEIPLKNERSLYHHTWAPAFAGVSGNLPAGTGVVERHKFMPFYWIGDNERGLFWFCESDEAWPNGTHADAIEVARSGAETVLRLNIKKSGQKLPRKWRFSFGLQATPVKPLPKDWRKWRLSPGRNANVQIIWPEPQPYSLRYYGYPETADPVQFGGVVKDIHGRGMKAVPYLCLTYLSAASPEWKSYRHEWAAGREDAACEDVTAYGAPFAMVSPRGRGWADFIVWKTTEFIKRHGVDGIYHDNTQPYEISAPEKGAGYLRNGERKSAFPILGYRDVYERMYKVLKATPRETFSIAHMSGKVDIPVLAFEDAYLDGEQLLDKVKDDYLEVLPLDAFRAEFMGRQWGLIPYFLPEFRGKYIDQVKPTRGMMALLMLHDVAPWPEWCNKAVVNEALAGLDAFGYVDADFIPYFDPVPPATADAHGVYVSAYRRKDGQLLLIVANPGRQDVKCSVALADRFRPQGGAKILGWPDKERLRLVNNRLPLSLEGQSYRFIRVGSAE